MATLFFVIIRKCSYTRTYMFLESVCFKITWRFPMWLWHSSTRFCSQRSRTAMCGGGGSGSCSRAAGMNTCSVGCFIPTWEPLSLLTYKQTLARSLPSFSRSPKQMHVTRMPLSWINIHLRERGGSPRSSWVHVTYRLLVHQWLISVKPNLKCSVPMEIKDPGSF